MKMTLKKASIPFAKYYPDSSRTTHYILACMYTSNTLVDYHNTIDKNDTDDDWQR